MNETEKLIALADFKHGVLLALEALKTVSGSDWEEMHQRAEDSLRSLID